MKGGDFVADKDVHPILALIFTLLVVAVNVAVWAFVIGAALKLFGVW